MKLYMRQKVFSWRNRFTVWDAEGRDAYYVEGEAFSFGHRLHVFDTQGREVMYIQQRVFSWLTRYELFIGSQKIAEIVREFTFFTPRYRFEGIDWEIEGNIFEHDYTIYSGRFPVASVSKEWFTFGDSYLIDIQNPRDERLALAAALAIDCTLARQ